MSHSTHLRPFVRTAFERDRPMGGRPTSRAAGAVMSEFVLALPFLLIILAFVVYFGRGMVRVQHAAQTARYEVWRQVAQAPGPAADDSTANDQLDATFFAAGSQSLDLSRSDRLPADAADELTAAAREFSQQTGDIVRDAVDRFPAALTLTVKAEHDNQVQAWDTFDGPINARHTRLDHEWKFVNGWTRDRGTGIWSQTAARQPYPADPWVHPVVRELVFVPLDDDLEDLARQDNPMARMTRDLYSARPGYKGPVIKNDGTLD